MFEKKNEVSVTMVMTDINRREEGKSVRHSGDDGQE